MVEKYGDIPLDNDEKSYPSNDFREKKSKKKQRKSDEKREWMKEKQYSKIFKEIEKKIEGVIGKGKFEWVYWVIAFIG